MKHGPSFFLLGPLDQLIGSFKCWFSGSRFPMQIPAGLQKMREPELESNKIQKYSIFHQKIYTTE